MTILYTLYSILYIRYTLYSIVYTLYTLLYTLYSILYTIYSIFYTLYYILYTLYSILYTPYSILYTLYFKLPQHASRITSSLRPPVITLHGVAFVIYLAQCQIPGSVYLSSSVSIRMPLCICTRFSTR